MSKEYKPTTGPVFLSEPVICTPLEVRVYNGGFDRAFRTFKAIVQKEKILSLYKEKQSYEKPSDRKRRKKADAVKRRLEAEYKEKLIASGEYDKVREKKQLLREQKMKDREERLNKTKSEQ